MRLTSRPRRTLEDLEAAAELVRPVQDRLTYEIAVDEIRPSARNPRHKIDGLDELASSLHEYGLLQPVVVRRVAGAYELIAGHRRLAAAQQLGWTQIAAVVRDETEDQAYLLTLTENLQREDLTPKEEAAALEVLVRERGWTTRQVGEAIKRSHIYVSRRLRVFDDPVLAPLVLERKLPVSTAEELLRVGDVDERKVLAQRAVRESWERAQVRAMLEARAVRPTLERCVPNETGHDQEETPRKGSASADLVVAALRSEIAEAWRLMHQWRARVAAHQAAGEAAYIWQAESQAHDLERRLRALLRVRRRARQLTRAAQ